MSCWVTSPTQSEVCFSGPSEYLSNCTRYLHKLWGQNKQNNHTHTFKEDKQANHIFSWPPHPAWWSFHSSWDIKRWECYGNTASSHPTLFKVWGNWDDRKITNKNRHNHHCYARAHFQFKQFMQVPTKTTKCILFASTISCEDSIGIVVPETNIFPARRGLKD